MMFVRKCQEIEYLNAQECKKKQKKKKIVEIIQSKKTKKIYVCKYLCMCNRIISFANDSIHWWLQSLLLPVIYIN